MLTITCNIQCTGGKKVYSRTLSSNVRVPCYIGKGSMGHTVWGSPPLGVSTRQLSSRMQRRYHGELPDASSQLTLQGSLRDMFQKPRAISLLVCLWGPFLTPWRSLSFCLLSEEECSNITGWATEGGFGAESGGKTTSTLLLCCIHNVMYYIYIFIYTY